MKIRNKLLCVVLRRIGGSRVWDAFHDMSNVSSQTSQIEYNSVYIHERKNTSCGDPYHCGVLTLVGQETYP